MNFNSNDITVSAINLSGGTLGGTVANVNSTSLLSWTVYGADGMHAGYLPGYPALHGCVRMPEQLAIASFNGVEVGTPVIRKWFRASGCDTTRLISNLGSAEA